MNSSSSICKSLSDELRSSLKGDNLTEILYKYHALLHCCGIENYADYQRIIKDAFKNQLINIDFLSTGELVFINDVHSLHFPVTTFSSLPTDDKLMQRFPDIHSFHAWIKTFDAYQVEDIITDNEHIIITKAGKYGIVNYDGDVILDCTYDGIRYLGHTFYGVKGEKTKCNVFNTHRNDWITTWSDDIKSYNVLSGDFYFIIQNKSKFTIIDGRNKVHVKEVSYVRISLDKKHLMVGDQEAYNVYDVDFRSKSGPFMSVNAIQLIKELVWKVSTLNNETLLLDANFNAIQIPGSYDEIIIENSPYVIVRKNDLYGIYDLNQNKYLCTPTMPHLNYICDGILSYKQDGFRYIIDVFGTQISMIPYTGLHVLRDQGKSLVTVFNNTAQYYVYDLLGNRIIESASKSVNYNENEQRIYTTSKDLQKVVYNTQGEIIK